MTEAAFHALIQENRPRLARICRVYGEDEEDQKDLFQEIAYQLWRSMAGFKGRSSLNTFVYRVALNTALSHMRRSKVRSTQHFEEGQPDTPVAPGFDQDLDRKEQLQALYHAIGQLRKSDRSLILLYLEDLSYQEMADITGLSVSNVGARLSRARQRLGQMLKEV